MFRIFTVLFTMFLAPFPAKEARRATNTRGYTISTLLAAALLVGGCGGGGSTTSSDVVTPVTENGTVVIGLTDAPGDFVGYTVAVESLTLTHTNGDIIETLPMSTDVDFAQLTEVTELFTIATVPAGLYESVQIGLNFTNAEVLVQDNAGDALLARVQDTEGNPLGSASFRLQLTTNDTFRVGPGIPSAFSLDFDLDASNTVDLTTSPPTVTVEPFILATPELEGDREHRIRGVLDSVDLADNSFNLHVRPFRHRTGAFGQFTVAVNDATQYEVDGTGLTGPSGLEAMADLDGGAPVIAFGSVESRSLAAEIVVAGSSVPWADADVLHGVVTSRVDNLLTIRGSRVEFADGRRVFRGEFSVEMSEDTVVSAPGIDNAHLSTQSVAPGQRIVVWGEFSDDQSLVATKLRMLHSQLTAEVVQTTPLAGDIFWLNGRRPSIFDFSGTGSTEADDADPSFYEIDTGTLPLATVEPGDLIRVRGFVNEFGMAPPDFLARSVIDIQTDYRAAQLTVGWTAGTQQPFVSTEPARVDVDITEARSTLKLRGVPRDVVDAASSVALVAPSSGMGVYAVNVRGNQEMRLYRSFADLVDALVAQLDAGNALYRITAQGHYASDTAELTMRRGGFVFAAPDTDTATAD